MTKILVLLITILLSLGATTAGIVFYTLDYTNPNLQEKIAVFGDASDEKMALPEESILANIAASESDATSSASEVQETGAVDSVPLQHKQMTYQL